MAFDKAFFEGIKPAAVRGKFYRKTEIDSLLSEIAARAELQNSENELLRLKLSQAEAALTEHTEGMNEVAKGIVSEAKGEAERIVSEAKGEAERIMAEAKTEAGRVLEEARGKSRGIIEATMRQQEFAAQKIEHSYSAMKEQHEECIDSIRAAWQEFLCGLDTEEEAPARDDVPSDLSEKVSAIADVMAEI